ncbi:putative autotransporter, partial [Caenibius tardaugens NBRC 16725]
DSGTLIGNAASIQGDIANAGTVEFDQASDARFAGSITGLRGTNGALVKSGAGNLALTGSSTLDWTLKAGGLTADAGLFTGNAAIGGGANLTFNQSANASYAGVLTGTGEFTKSGAGSLVLTGDSSAFAGETTVAGGRLAVNGALGGAVTVLDGGLLGGSGIISNLSVIGTVAPGNSIGTLHVGNITFASGSSYEVEINAAGQSDKIVASGKVTINGGTVKVLAGTGNYAPATTYNILTANPAAGGVDGTFSGVTSNLAFLDPSLSYDAGNVYLTMTRNDVSFRDIGVTPNQKAMGSGIEALAHGNPIWDAVVQYDADTARNAFNQLSGEIHPSARTALIEDSRFVRNAIGDRIRAAVDSVAATDGMVTTYDDHGPLASAASTDRFAVWGQAFGSWGHIDGDGNAARLNRSTGGFFLGADAPAFDTWRFGAVVGYSSTGFKARARYSSGSSDNYHVGVYGGTTWGGLAFRTGATYTWHDITTSRTVAIPGVTDSPRSDYNAGTAQVFGELGYRMQARNVAFEPFGNLAYVNIHTDSFAEKGSVATLSTASGSTNTAFTALGLRAATTFDLGASKIRAKGMLGWRHAFGDISPQSAMRFVSGGDAFSIGSVPIARDAGLVEAGLEYAFTPNATLDVVYQGQSGHGLADQSIRVNLNVTF